MNDYCQAIIVFLDSGEVLYCHHCADAEWWQLRFYTMRN